MRAGCTVSLALLISLGACGSDATTNRHDAKAVFQDALRALGRADLSTLHGLLTKRGRRTFMADLRAFRDGLELPSTAQVATRALIEARYPGEADARVQTARRGGPQAALALLVTVRPITIPEAPRREERSTDVQVFFYRDAQDVERAVHLLRDESGWLVDRLGF